MTKSTLPCRKVIISNGKNEKGLFMPCGDIMLSIGSEIPLEDGVWTIVRYTDEYKDLPM